MGESYWHIGLGENPKAYVLLADSSRKRTDLRESFRWGRDRNLIKKVLICFFLTFQNAWKESGYAYITIRKSSLWYRQRHMQGFQCYQHAFSGSCPAAIAATSTSILITLSGSSFTGDCRAQGKVSQEISLLCLVVMWKGAFSSYLIKE